jgi:hypothetical protein
LNLLKVIDKLSTPPPQQKTEDTAEKITPNAQPKKNDVSHYNALATVIERHDKLSSEIKNRKKGT